MKRFTVRLSPEAQTDLVSIHANIVQKTGSVITADRYIERISIFLNSFDVFPERGTVRNEIRTGLRIVGFERSASVAFIVEEESVIVLGIAPKGRQVSLGDDTD
ncbi:plasmid stabilization protein [Rhizobium rhizosphaerae]|uniref:Plasmid stabilization protein n=1 Tax=Xaviernesmea rhizosphaerae TaxID=1672749 RepID=A0ABX3PHK8_9HYPH|nr:type II toxin-antitoxin system RelE/ParE family toxin [Xaviernesmea rhizosphaerae]OQP87622.1 plasmid stabilization protein [Xaviernesmea rhizosphaerae]